MVARSGTRNEYIMKVTVFLDMTSCSFIVTDTLEEPVGRWRQLVTIC
jgi:hypothetical protein